MKILPLALLLSAVATFASAGPKSDDAALSILGQADFTKDDSLDPPTSRSLNNAEGVAVDPTSGKLFVSDGGNHRILRYSSTAAYQTFAPAEAVFGQPDFTSNDPNRGGLTPAADSLNLPLTLCFDGNGNLWVADAMNARVLRYNKASSKPAFGAMADGVIGQPNFTSDVPAQNEVGDSGFVSPAGVAVDRAGNLYVSDYGIPRILRFEGAANLSGDVPHTSYLGQVDSDEGEFVSETSANAVGSDVYGLSVGPSGSLWVADTSNYRVLRFDDPTTSGSGASLVLGQVDMTTLVISPVPTAKSMNLPYYVTIAPDGTLWVSDYDNHRVLGFLNAENKATGGAADIVLGQASFTDNAERDYSARALLYPTQIAIGQEGSLFIGEYNPGSRVMRWSDPVTITAPNVVKVKRTIARVFGSSAGATAVSYTIARQKGIRAAQGSAAQWLAVAKKLKKKKTVLTVTATAFDGRRAEARVLVKVVKKKKK